MFLIMILAFLQNISFTIVSRSRNRNNFVYHLIAAVFSNAVWFMTFRYLIVNNQMNWKLFIPYTIGTVSGSLLGATIAAKIEKKIDARADGFVDDKKA